MSPRGAPAEQTVLVKVVKGPAAAPATRPRTRLIASDKDGNYEVAKERGKK